ncbi:MAG: hypothetical protein K2X47_02555 [Bdellovibrionales bacterium]|nr:hypothetical protein [Bdellovibrionales bacterium]
MRYLLALVSAVVVSGVVIGMMSGKSPKNSEMIHLSSTGDRTKSHFEAEAFLRGKHFYRNGKGMFAGGILSKKVALINSKPALEPALSAVEKRWGLMHVPSESSPMGLFQLQENGATLTVAGCVLCHAGKAAGIPIIGLGNKNIDITLMAQDLLKESEVSKSLRDSIGRTTESQKSAIQFLKGFTAGNNGNLTQGLVPASRIRAWFYQSAGQTMPADEARAQVKVPHWWGFARKKEVGIDWDGYGEGVGWALGVELAAGQEVSVAAELVPEADRLLQKIAQLLPPRYPFETDSTKARTGKNLFEKACSKCHGHYQKDSDGFPIFETPIHVSQRIVGTDPDRLRGNTIAFAQLVDMNPFSTWMKRGPGGLRKESGYIAPRLEGIWSRFPYLHNGSVPTLADLFLAPELRPRFWSLKDAGELYRFTKARVGLSIPTSPPELQRLYARATRGDRDIYSVERVGHSNQGHWFAEMKEFSSRDIEAVVEYLKGL